MSKRNAGKEKAVQIDEAWKREINFNKLGAEKKRRIEAAVARLGDGASEDDRTRAAQEAADGSRKVKPPQKVCKTLKENVWRASHGQSGEGECLICQRVVTVWEFDVCHKISKKNGGVLELPNLFVGCHECNKRQGSMNLDEYLAIRRSIKPPQPSSSTEAMPACGALPSDALQVAPAQCKYDKALQELTVIESALIQEGRQPAKNMEAILARTQRQKDVRLARAVLADLAIKRRAEVSFGERLVLKRLLGYDVCSDLTLIPSV